MDTWGRSLFRGSALDHDEPPSPNFLDTRSPQVLEVYSMANLSSLDRKELVFVFVIASAATGKLLGWLLFFWYISGTSKLVCQRERIVKGVQKRTLRTFNVNAIISLPHS